MDGDLNEGFSAFEETAAASAGGPNVSPQRLQYLMNHAAAYLGELADDLHNNMAELRIVTSLMKGAVDLWQTSRST